MTNIRLNGQNHEIPEGLDLAKLLQQLDLNPSKVAVAKNLEVIPRSQLEITLLQQGDEVEIFRAVGGG